jgi:hypothetical protein
MLLMPATLQTFKHQTTTTATDVSVGTTGTLIISIISASLALVNEKLLLQAVDTSTLSELGLTVYTKTQNILAPHNDSRTLFGNTIKFNESDSVVISAPVSDKILRYNI